MNATAANPQKSGAQKPAYNPERLMTLLLAPVVSEKATTIGDKNDQVLMDLFARIADNLAAHATIEEKLFYPSVYVGPTAEKLQLRQAGRGVTEFPRFDVLGVHMEIVDNILDLAIGIDTSITQQHPEHFPTQQITLIVVIGRIRVADNGAGCLFDSLLLLEACAEFLKVAHRTVSSHDNAGIIGICGERSKSRTVKRCDER